MAISIPFCFLRKSRVTPFVWLCFCFICDAVSAQQLNVINLLTDTVRWKRLLKELETNDIAEDNINRLEAVHGKSMTQEELNENASWRARTFCPLGTIGCYLSHRKFWHQVVDGSDPYQIVLEDDVVLEPNFVARASAMVEELEASPVGNEWDVLLLGALGSVDPRKRFHFMYEIPAFCAGGCRQQKQIAEHIHIPKRPFGTHAYAISKRGAKKLLDLAWKATYHVDSVVWGIPELNLFNCDPLLAYQDSSCVSTVGSVTSGIETWIPSGIMMDQYTKMPLVWVWNEPVLRIPILNVIITQGRYLIFGILGTLLGLSQYNEHPWFLQGFLSFFFPFIASFTRWMSRPLPK